MSRNSTAWPQALDALTWSDVRWTLDCTGQGRLPRWLGSTLRGAWAAALRRTGCALRCAEPASCLLRARCPYAVCFETPVPPGATRLRSVEHLPHPLVVQPPPAERAPRTWRPGDRLVFSCRIFGRAREHFPFLLVAADAFAKHGLGADKAPFRLAGVKARGEGSEWTVVWPGPQGAAIPIPPSQHLEPPPPAPSAVAVHFRTPTRLVERGRVVAEFSLRTLVRSAMSRLSAMLAFHCDSELEVDFADILRRVHEDTELVDRDVRRVPLKRWSNRQQRRIGLEGVVGTVVWRGPGLAAAWPYLWAGRITHVGKGAIFGLGSYELEALA